MGKLHQLPGTARQQEAQNKERSLSHSLLRTLGASVLSMIVGIGIGKCSSGPGTTVPETCEDVSEEIIQVLNEAGSEFHETHFSQTNNDYEDIDEACREGEKHLIRATEKAKRAATSCSDESRNILAKAFDTTLSAADDRCFSYQFSNTFYVKIRNTLNLQTPNTDQKK